VAGKAGAAVRRYFLTVFICLWLALFMAGLLLVTSFFHSGVGLRVFLHMPLHDLIIFLIAGGVFCFVVSSYLTKPLNLLAQAAANIAEGRLNTRVDPALKNRRDEIAELARNFDRMADRIEALVTGQRRLLGDVSHELRSPLARLIVALGLAKQGPPEEIAENLERIGVETRRLDTLIGQLLTLTRIDSGAERGTATRFDLTNLVQEVANDADFEARARNRRVVLTRSDACTVQGFEELLRSAVENVVRNAVRYTAEGTAVEISLQNHAGVSLSVRDHGPGVPESLLTEIFLPFHRAGNDGHDGAGLGLAIAQRAIGLHKGKVAARNAPDGGLVVEIHLAAA
jgi:two-component system sensor histidine kinase CpxA